MDELDRKILGELQSKGFQNSTALSNILSVGERTIRRRINTMLTNGIIRIIAVPNPVLLGFRAWSKIGIKVSPGSLSNVASVLVNHPSIYFVAYALGRFDMIIAVHFETIDRLAYFVNSELPRVDGILYTETWMLVSPRKYYHFLWPAPVFQKTDSTLGYHRNYEVDEVDRKILNILREDGLTRPGSLKTRLGIGETTIRKHMKAMLYNEVYKIAVVPNPEVLELDTWATMGITINRQFTNGLIDSIIKYPAVYLASACLGRFNIIIAARFHDVNSQIQFVTTDLMSIPGIDSVETYLHNKPLKYRNITWPHLINRSEKSDLAEDTGASAQSIGSFASQP